MREIKFRALPEMDGKDYIYYPEINFTIRKNEFVYGYYLDGFIVDEVIDGNQDYLELNMWIPIIKETVGQYTGLKDKNGVEIYEGDILRFSDKWEWYRGSTSEWWGMTHKEKLEWIDKQPYHKYTVEYNAPEYNVSKTECYNYYEVIGNIHEYLQG